uniref:Uncharacterized protein n=1 Tax=Arundo donax TaxID=35708 RepID=A0A0A9EGT2_ARUDO
MPRSCVLDLPTEELFGQNTQSNLTARATIVLVQNSGVNDQIMGYS